ncbi:FAD-binding domain-containing protein [Alkalinema pantanalense CENA528]|uniref:FAD-binding domain-containing protein n=1 Tax=Alkalinema pantanalense TaxID=1620705 RepID=UPI003D6ECA53
MSDLVLFWHRRDLRIADNVGLAMARQKTRKVVGVFCLDPAILQRDDIADVRVDYLLGSLRSLAQRYLEAGSQLLFLHDRPTDALPELAKNLAATAVYWNWDVEPYAQERDNALIHALHEVGVEVVTAWDQLLHTPQEIFAKATQAPYTVYTPFWKNWRSQPKATPYAELTGAIGLSETEQETAQRSGGIELPTLKELGFSWGNGQILEPGELAAQQRLSEFIEQQVGDYDIERNFPANPGTSTLSPALKFGTIGIRTVWAATQTATEQARSEETQKGITTWQQELAWREFYQHVLFHFPELEQGAYRAPFKNFPWDNNDDRFQAWCEGRTGYPIVDAAMRQLNETGWMHNRCRMIVASFLTKDLIIDFRWGEKYFMQRLVDGDLAANNGGWQWSASSGMDPKPLRIFNPTSQAQKFDAEAEYIRHWLPELRSAETAELISGKIDKGTRDRAGYPKPIVDHAVQQRLFKERYAAQKAQAEST